MQKHSLFLALSLFATAPTFATAAAATKFAPLLVAGPSVELAGSQGKFDFLEIDLVGRRLLGSHTQDGTVDVFDLVTPRLLSRVASGAAQDTAIDADSGRYFAAVSKEQKVAVIDAKTLVVVGSVATEGPLDGIVFVPKNRCVYAAHDDGKELWVVDPVAQKIVATVAIPGAPECMLYDAGTDRIYLNIKTTDEIVAIDPTRNVVVSHWPTTPATGPHGLALDSSSNRLFSAGANGQLAVIDLRSGKLVCAVAITPKVDQIAFDPGLQRVYCAANEVMTVVQETPDGAVSLGDVATAPGAKNVAVDPKTHAVWTTYTDGKNAYAKCWLVPSL
jgi:DNA-binding beta-propeller fold protein YncE